MLGQFGSGRRNGLLQGIEVDIVKQRAVDDSADGRGISQDSIKVIGEGRVWTGEHALKLGLVDELGNLESAIAKAKELAKIEEYTELSYPAEVGFFQSLLDNASADSYADKKVAETFGEYYDLFSTLKRLNPKGSVQAELPYKFKFNL